MNSSMARQGWTNHVFGNLVKNINDYFDSVRDGVLPYVAGPHISLGKIMVSAYGSTADDDFPPTFKRKFHPGDVLLHSRGIEKLAVVDRIGVTGEKLFVLRTRDQNLLLQEFLPWLLLSARVQAHLQDNFTGSVNKFLNWKPLSDMQVALPPIEEQKRISDLLWGIEGYGEALSTIDAPLLSCQTPLMEFEAESYITVGDVIQIARSGSTPLRSNKDFFGGNIPWLKSGEIVGDNITYSEETITEAGLRGSATWLVPEGAVVVAMYGDGKTRGQVGRLGAPMCTNQAVLALVVDPVKADPDFFYYWLRSRQYKLREKGAGAAQKNLSKSLIISEPFPKLSIEEQLSAAKRISALDKSLIPIRTEQMQLAALKGSLLTKIFGGAQ